MKQKTRVLLVDDHPMFSESMANLLAEIDQIELVGTALNGKVALEFLKEKEADLLITDIEMPDMDGIVLSEHIKKKYPKIKLVVLTMHHDRTTILKMIDHGAEAYLSKDMGKEAIKEALEKVMEGERHFPESIQKTLFEQKAPEKSYAEQVRFTPQEMKVLRLLRKGLSSREIADQLILSPYTIRSHRQNMMSKAQVKNTAALINYAIENGLI